MEDRILRMKPLLDEKQWRLYLANEAMSAGYGGVSKVSRITGVSRTTITKGMEELKEEKTNDGRVRRSGGGPKYVEEKHPDIEERIRKIVDGSTYGNPERVLSYTTESLRKIETELESQGITVSYKTVGKILDSMNYSKQTNQKMLQLGEPHPDRNAQFEHINDTAVKYLKAGAPIMVKEIKTEKSTDKRCVLK